MSALDNTPNMIGLEKNMQQKNIQQKSTQQKNAHQATSSYKQIKSSTHNESIMALTSQIVSAYVTKHDVDPDNIAALIEKTYDGLMRVQKRHDNRHDGVANNSKDSITDDYLICLEDGKKLKMLKRHLRTNYNMTPQEYRAKWGLPSDYPMVAPNYAAKRSQYAKNFGLGRSSGSKSN